MNTIKIQTKTTTRGKQTGYMQNMEVDWDGQKIKPLKHGYWLELTDESVTVRRPDGRIYADFFLDGKHRDWTL